MRRSWMFVMAGLAAFGFLLSGCAAQHFATPTSGRSRVEQVLLSTTLDEAVNQMTQQGLDPLTGKKVFVRVGDLEPEGTVSDYVRTTVEHRLASLGVVPVETVEEADVVMIVRARVAGTDRSATPTTLAGFLGIFSLLLDYNKVWCGADLDAQAVDRKNATILLATRPTGSATNTCTEWSILPIVFSGPFSLTVRTCSVESPVLR